MESQIKQIKLSATNIKGTLIRGNKELKKLRIKERNIFNRQRISAKRSQKESFVEGGIPGSGMVAGAARRMAAPAMSIIDKIKEFAGNVLLGILLNNLPSLIQRVDQFIKENSWLFKTIGDVFKITGDLFMVLVDITLSLNPKRAQLEKERIELSQNLANLVGATNDLDVEATAADNAVNDYVGDVTKEELRQKTPQQVKSDVISAIKEQEIKRPEFVKSVNQYIEARKLNEVTKSPIVIPGVGSYERVLESTWGGGLWGNTKQIAKDTYGYEITPEEFEKRYQYVRSDWTSMKEQLTSEGVQGYSKGGTVKPVTSSSGRSNQSFPGESATARKARESTQSFSKFETGENTRSFLLDDQEENNSKFEKLIDNFKELYSVGITTSGPLPPSPYTTNRPNAPGPVIPTPSGLPGIKVEPTEVIGTVGHSGYTVPAGPGGSHIHIENMSNYGDGIPQAVKYSILVNGNPMPQALQFTSGIGWRWGKMHRGEDFAGNPNQPISLTGGLKFKQFIPDQGDGYGNRVLIEAPDGTIYSLNHLNAGPKNINALVKKQQNLGQGNSTSGPGSPGYGGQGGRATDLTQTFDDGGSEVVMIMAQQPVIVPGPTRYITRTRTQTMPVPVQIAPKSSGLRSLV